MFKNIGIALLEEKKTVAIATPQKFEHYRVICPRFHHYKNLYFGPPVMPVFCPCSRNSWLGQWFLFVLLP